MDRSSAVKIVVGFIFFFSTIGILKSAFGNPYPGNCTVLICEASIFGFFNVSWTPNVSPGYIENTDGTLGYSPGGIAQSPRTGFYINVFKKYYYDPGLNSWIPSGMVAPHMTEGCIVETLPPGCNTCEFEKKKLIEQCKGNENINWTQWDQKTCSGAVCEIINETQFGGPTCPVDFN